MSLTLILDRTAADVNSLKSLAAKGWNAMTTAEREIWEGEPKGAYNASDLNRVGTAVLSVQAALSNAGYVVNVTAKTDWMERVAPTPEQLSEYIANISTIRSVEICPAESPSAPSTIQLTYQTENDIEQILSDIYDLIETFFTWDALDAEDMTWTQLDAMDINWGNYFIRTVI